MLFHELEDLVRVKPITQIDLRVVVYARVSTDSETQQSSIQNQNDFYVDMVRNNPHWTLVEVYTDEGISGMSVSKREEFNRMISDAKAGKFDLIITKTVSRFARNTVDSLKYTRELKQYGVGVWFQLDSILTFEKDSELKLTIFAALAQNESEKKSEAVRFGLQQAIKKGTVFGFDNMWGYRKKGGKLVIDEREAPIVRMIFEMYATDRYSMKQMEDRLYDMGVRNRKGGKLNHVTMSKIIRNPKYKGYFVGHKVKQTDIFTKKFIMLPEEEWIMYKDESIVPAIVSEELWDRANAVLERRSKDVRERQNLCKHQNLMTGKMICAHCGKIYHRKASKDKRGNEGNSAWVCAGKIQNGAASCPSRYIYEDELRAILFDIFKDTTEDLELYMRSYEELFTKASGSAEAERKRECLLDEIDKLKKRKKKLLAYNADGEITDREFLEMKKEIDGEILEKEKAIAKLQDALFSKKAAHARLKEIRRALEGLRAIEHEDMIDDVFVRNYIEKITVEIVDKVPHLTIRLVTGREFSEQLEILRTSNMTKRLVEQAERAMSNQQG